MIPVAEPEGRGLEGKDRVESREESIRKEDREERRAVDFSVEAAEAV